MKKLVVFNVGGALCCYLEIADHSFLIDIGEGKEFSPVNSFLLPYCKASGKQKEANGKYKIDQLIISHPHRDHISGIMDFDKSFYPGLITCPNNKNTNAMENIDWGLFSNGEKDECVSKLIEMCEDRSTPLRKVLNGQSIDSQYIYYIKPGVVALDDVLKNESYANNISLTCLFKINGFSVFFPGDIMKEGFKKLLDCKELTSTFDLRSGLRRFGVDILIAPHHGLKSAFSTEFFDTLPNHKVRSIIIASEKQNNPDENREVDGRYSDGDYCEGRNDLASANGASENYFRKTSQGHICIDFETAGYPDIRIIEDDDELIKWFLSQ